MFQIVAVVGQKYKVHLAMQSIYQAHLKMSCSAIKPHHTLQPGKVKPLGLRSKSFQEIVLYLTAYDL